MSTLGCIRAKIGTTPYYITKIRVGELIRSVGIAKELPEWDDMTADEKMQRECDLRRVVEEIVPYLVQDPDHFFGSLIVDIFSGFDEIVFEPLMDVISNVPIAYRIPLQDFGTLTLPGRERLIALDGQHRLLALKIAVMGESGVPAGYSKKLSNLKPHPELVSDEISVILVNHTDNLKIRKIFNKINKYAKQTSRSDNIITSDDDLFAVIARKLIEPGQVLAPVPSEKIHWSNSSEDHKDIEIVNWKNTTLSERSKNLTTISALYTIAETILKSPSLNAKTLLCDEQKDAAYAEIQNFWETALASIDAFKEYMKNTYNDSPVSGLRSTNLLLKPVTQMALAHVARKAKECGVSWSSICKCLNNIDWSYENELWHNILVIASSNKKVIVGKESVRQAGLVISYMAMGRMMTKTEIEEVRRIVRNARNNEKAELPPTYTLEEEA